MYTYMYICIHTYAQLRAPVCEGNAIAKLVVANLGLMFSFVRDLNPEAPSPLNPNPAPSAMVSVWASGQANSVRWPCRTSLESLGGGAGGRCSGVHSWEGCKAETLSPGWAMQANEHRSSVCCRSAKRQSGHHGSLKCGWPPPSRQGLGISVKPVVGVRVERVEVTPQSLDVVHRECPLFRAYRSSLN